MWIMKASDWRWYGRSEWPEAKPDGSATSTGYTCCTASRILSQLQRLTYREGRDAAEGAADEESAAPAAGGLPPLALYAARIATHEGSVCVALQWLSHSAQSEAGPSQQ